MIFCNSGSGAAATGFRRKDGNETRSEGKGQKLVDPELFGDKTVRQKLVTMMQRMSNK